MEPQALISCSIDAARGTFLMGRKSAAARCRFPALFLVFLLGAWPGIGEGGCRLILLSPGDCLKGSN